MWLLRLIGSVEDLHQLFFSVFRPDGHGSDRAICWVFGEGEEAVASGHCDLSVHQLLSIAWMSSGHCHVALEESTVIGAKRVQFQGKYVGLSMD